eukprot:scaffold1770_cov375-Prasinococcus_capsulatus_cf.AAC.5
MPTAPAPQAALTIHSRAVRRPRRSGLRTPPTRGPLYPAAAPGRTRRRARWPRPPRDDDDAVAPRRSNRAARARAAAIRRAGPEPQAPTGYGVWCPPLLSRHFRWGRFLLGVGERCATTRRARRHARTRARTRVRMRVRACVRVPSLLRPVPACGARLATSPPAASSRAPARLASHTGGGGHGPRRGRSGASGNFGGWRPSSPRSGLRGRCERTAGARGRCIHMPSRHPAPSPTAARGFWRPGELPLSLPRRAA